MKRQFMKIVADRPKIVVAHTFKAGKINHLRYVDLEADVP